jgi:hypothetical protein
MDIARKFILEKLVDQTMTFDAGLAGKCFRHYEDAKVALAGAGRIAMAGMKLRLVDDVEPRRTEPNHQFFPDAAFNGHITSFFRKRRDFVTAGLSRKGLLSDCRHSRKENQAVFLPPCFHRSE